MRFPGLGGQVMANVGVNIQNLPGGEIYLALERGAIDAADWVGPYDDQILGLNKAAKYYYMPSWAEPGPAVGMYVNLELYTSLPSDLQQVLQTAAAATDRSILSEYDAKNGKALRELVDGGTELRTFPDEVLKAFQDANTKLLDQFAGQNPGFKKVYDNWSAFRDTVRYWQKTGQYAFDRFTFEGS